jgi:hypothetical protein
MAQIDGGRIAARGFQYQYLRTIETLLTCTQKQAVHACRIEGPANLSSLSSVNMIDFDLIDQAGNCLLAAQVKSASEGRQISAPLAFSILLNLTTHEARQYQLVTAAEPDKRCRRLSLALEKYGNSAIELRAALGAILTNAPKAKTVLANLDNIQLDRLGRARIEFDHREDGEIRKQLHDTLQDFRARHHAALGSKSAGLVLGYLISEIMDRAAVPQKAEWTIEDFSEKVLIDNATLTNALGRQDWGAIYGPIPPVPDIRRDDLMERVSDVFARRSDDRRKARTCALTGLSGIGKSSAAAAYIAERADEYDLVCWIDASTYETLIASFRRLRDHLYRRDGKLADTNTMQYLREEVHNALLETPGRWLAVFDDAAPHRVFEWLPKFGAGDILITSLDSMGWRHVDGNIEITRMTHREAMQLFSLRLSLKGNALEAYRDILTDLIDYLEGWPLAIELSCGYLITCGVNLGRVQEYRAALINRAMDDRISVPPGYPRTLVAAILVSIRRLREYYANDPQFFQIVRQMMASICYFAPQRIPLHLAFLSAFVPSSEVPTDKHIMPIMDEARAPVREAVRALIQVSFAHYSEPLPVSREIPELPSEVNDTISLNSVLQEVLRTQFEPHSAVHRALPQMAFHVNRWLSRAIDLMDGDRSWEIAQHATALIKHIERLDIRDNDATLLLGNLAAFNESQGEYPTARRLLRQELSWLREVQNPNTLLTVQALITLAHLHQLKESASEASRITALLEEAEPYIEDVAHDHEPAAAFLVTRVLLILDAQLIISPLDSALEALHSRFNALMRFLPATEITAMMNEGASVAQLLAEDREEEAEQAARSFLQNYAEPDTEHLVAVVETRRFLIEILARQYKWEEAGTELEKILPFFTLRSMYRYSAQNLVHNVGFVCAIQWVIGGSEEAGELLTKVLNRAGPNVSRDAMPAGTRARFALLDAVAAAIRDDYTEFKSSLEQVMTSSFVDNAKKDEAEAWESLVRLLPDRIAVRISRKKHGLFQKRSNRIISELGISPFQDVRIQRILSEARAKVHFALSTHGIFQIFEDRTVRKFLDFYNVDDVVEHPFVIAVFQPSHMVGIDHETEGMTELHIHLACESGFRRMLSGTLSIPTLDWTVQMTDLRIELRDSNGRLWAIGNAQPDQDWIKAANREGRILTFYGWGFYLDEAGNERFTTESAEIFRRRLDDAASKGLLAAGFARWVR